MLVVIMVSHIENFKYDWNQREQCSYISVFMEYLPITFYCLIISDYDIFLWTIGWYIMKQSTQIAQC